MRMAGAATSPNNVPIMPLLVSTRISPFANGIRCVFFFILHPTILAGLC